MLLKYAIFGAGNFGRQAAELVGLENVIFFVDNNVNKQGKKYISKEVLSLENAMNYRNINFVIAVSDEYSDAICNQLIKRGVSDFELFKDLKFRITRERLQSRPNYINLYDKAIKWIYKNTVASQNGIINNSMETKAYPEVTGYYIPSLLRWGHKDLAIDYAKWLCSVQHESGAWYDTNNENPYIFDSAQILKGLIAIRDILPEVDEYIIRGCNWILSNMTEEGRLIAPIENAWGDGKTFSELIHTYCISPIREAGIILDRPDYIENADLIADYYTTKCRDQILNFDLLSHFYAYVMEAMLDIGYEDLAREAMSKIAIIQKKSGAVPAYNNVDWVCSTGLFQLAIVWFRLGEIENGEKAFEYACKLQNESGGWFGSYLSEENPNEVNTYFPNAEISWAVKYFLDALYYKNKAQFEKQAPIFGENIDIDDGRFVCIKDVVAKNKQIKILDVGCGKGRYIKNLIKKYPNNEYYATDLSLPVMKYFDLEGVEKRQGSLTDIPYDDSLFDVVYTCEALEHAVDIASAVKEMCRVTKSGGTVAILDKNKDMLGYFSIEEWEQWFDENELKNELLKYCSEVEIKKEISFDGIPSNGLFYCWIGKTK